MRVVLAFASVVMVLAGCGAPSSPPALSDDGVPGVAPEDLEPGLGALTGVIVDSVIRPVAGVNVTLQHPGDEPLHAATDAQGLFSFAPLEPGAYALSTENARYLDSTQAVVVEAGQVARVQLTLEPLVSNAAFSTVLHFSGFLECSFFGSNTCAAVNLATGEPTTNDDAFPKFPGHWTGYNRAPDWIQTEATWTPSATAASSISLCHTAASAEEVAAGDPYHIGFHWVHDGPPTYLAWNHTFAVENELGTVRDPVYLATNGPFSFLPDPPVSRDYRLGIALEQSFDLYLITFYGYTPPPDWRFLEEPQIPQPP